MRDMFNRNDAADVFSAVVKQSCPFAAYCDGTHTVAARRLSDGRIGVRVDDTPAGIYDTRDFEDVRSVVDDMLVRVAARV